MSIGFLDKIENSYSIPSSICIGSGNEPTDIRQTCETIQDFQDIADMGMELRYDGLVTYETTTGLWKGCRLIGGSFQWIEIGSTPDLSDYAKKDHKHKEYLPELSSITPDTAMPEGHVWLESKT